MSNYRDDVHDLVTIRDSTFSRMQFVLDDRARIRDTAMAGVGQLVQDAARVNDQVIERTRITLHDHAIVAVAVSDLLHARSVVQERVRVVDQALGRQRIVHNDALQVSDELAGRVRTVLTDALQIADTVHDARRVVQLVQDRVRIGDHLLALRRDLVEDRLHAADEASTRLRLRQVVADSLLAQDHATGRLRGATVAHDRLKLGDFAHGVLFARDTVRDGAVIEDAAMQAADFGQAWTAELGVWAMSRYAPFTFTGVVSINGVAYLSGPSGVFALDGDTEAMTATLQTAPLDMSPDVLMRPIEAHIEYELDGTAQMEVLQTQNGQQAQPFTYDLPARPADYLTNARFRFGRGLRGRHYAYALRLTGTSAYINDWKVLAEPSKRSL